MLYFIINALYCDNCFVFWCLFMWISCLALPSFFLVMLIYVLIYHPSLFMSLNISFSFTLCGANRCHLTIYMFYLFVFFIFYLHIQWSTNDIYICPWIHALTWEQGQAGATFKPGHSGPEGREISDKLVEKSLFRVVIWKTEWMERRARRRTLFFSIHSS